MKFYILDVFAEGQYTGNQLAVFRGKPDDAMMQKLALEMHFSETTFVMSDTPENGGYNVRIFTPANELPFAGHPTLGTAYLIRHAIIQADVPEVRLNLKVGQIPVRFGEDGFVWMRQNPPKFGEIYPAQALADSLGLSIEDIDMNFPIQAVSTGMPYIIVPINTLDAVQRAEMQLATFKQILQRSGLNADAIFFFAPQTLKPENQLHARAFVHLHGIPEDPATGSANGDLAGWLSQYRYFGSDKVQARVEQGYEINRPSLLLLDAHAAGDEIVVNVGGRVQLVAQGELA